MGYAPVKTWEGRSVRRSPAADAGKLCRGDGGKPQLIAEFPNRKLCSVREPSLRIWRFNVYIRAALAAQYFVRLTRRTHAEGWHRAPVQLRGATNRTACEGYRFTADRLVCRPPRCVLLPLPRCVLLPQTFYRLNHPNPYS
jgi:hypothetical protein